MDYPELKHPALWRDGDDIRGYLPDPGPGPWFTTEQVHAAIQGAVATDRAQRAAPGVQGGDAVCCNADCTWGGKLTDCVMCGQVGPLCPECREVVEPCGAAPQQSAQPVAGQYTLIHQVKIWGTWHHCTLDGWGAAPECDRRVLYGYLAAQPVEVQRVPLTDGAKEFIAYLKDCDECSIQPDTAGAFHAGWLSAHGIKPTSSEGGA